MSTPPAAFVYWMPIQYPNTKAHSIQVTRTVHALSAQREVHLVVQKTRRAERYGSCVMTSLTSRANGAMPVLRSQRP